MDLVNVADADAEQVFQKVDQIIEIADAGNGALIAVDTVNVLVPSAMFGNSYLVNNQTFEA